MRITTAQIRAARALLNWSQSDLAKGAGVSSTSIGSIESGATQPRDETLTDIRRALEEAGIEFTENEGVRRRSNDVMRYDGVEGLRRLMDELYDFAGAGDCDIALLNANPENWPKWLGKEWLKMHLDRMADLKTKVTYRIVTKRGIKNLISKGFAEYRYVPEELFNDRSIYCYGDKIAFVDFGQEKVTIYILNQRFFAQSFKVLFDVAWDNVAERQGGAR